MRSSGWFSLIVVGALYSLQCSETCFWQSAKTCISYPMSLIDPAQLGVSLEKCWLNKIEISVYLYFCTSYLTDDVNFSGLGLSAYDIGTSKRYIIMTCIEHINDFALFTIEVVQLCVVIVCYIWIFKNCIAKCLLCLLVICHFCSLGSLKTVFIKLRKKMENSCCW